MKRVPATCRLATAVLAISFLYAPAVFAGPPARPMVISGEVLVDGKPAPEGAELKLLVGQAEVSTGVKNTEAGTTYYRLLIPPFDPDKPGVPGATEGSLVRFVSLGAESLAAVPSLSWKPGPVLQNVLVKTVIQQSPMIVAAAAVQDSNGKWLLTARIRPVDPEKSGSQTVSYRVKWLVRKSTTRTSDGLETGIGKAVEEILTSIDKEADSSLYFPEVITDSDLFELNVTPVSGDGKYGPSAGQVVYPVLSKGEL